MLPEGVLESPLESEALSRGLAPVDLKAVPICPPEWVTLPFDVLRPEADLSGGPAEQVVRLPVVEGVPMRPPDRVEGLLGVPC